ncbi:cytochrome c family protein [Rhodoblastus sp.]|jgi:cytochrome c|uniref:c-type cytochrome n=1 Tax=Rhodoblastus sp. TaxID=1962975 RepID=UPI0025DE5733|nr:cytochrome c family protein [Rhodoblastus sp.]
MARCEVDPPQAEQEVMQAKVLILSAALFAGLAIGAQAAEEIKGDPKAGEIVFNKCRQCHHIGKGATNFYGPVLNGLIGRPAGTVPGYNYSEANKHSGKVWDVVTLTSYLKQPQHDVPATYMTFTGLKGDQDIANVIAYIAQFDRSGAMNEAK